MTYRDLWNTLISLHDDQLDSDLTIMVDDEFYPAELAFVNAPGGDVLDDKHPFFRISGDNSYDLVSLKCQRCGSELKNDRCSDVTCPFSEHKQDCPAGWEGHPHHNTGPCNEG